MTARVEVRPELLIWACERTGLGMDSYAKRFPNLEAWVAGDARPTIKQLESLAKATHTPIGYLFLEEPPEERIPIPDFRTSMEGLSWRPTPDLLDTIYTCQQRQEWYREFARSRGNDPHPFVGSASVGGDVEDTAGSIRNTLGFDLDARASMPTWTDALRRFIDQADAAGIMVMCSGVVMNDNHRHLNPDEFRGFALADALAPLVFINGADTKAAQMFTLAHELAHVWLDESALSDSQALQAPEHDIERWCNEVAAEVLVPLAVLRREYRTHAELSDEVDRLARRFKVSTLVALRRIHDAGGIGKERLWQEYEREIARLRGIPKGSGGNFYLTQAARVSKRFARAIVVSTWEGRSSFTEAFRLLGVKRMDSFRGMGEAVGMVF